MESTAAINQAKAFIRRAKRIKAAQRAIAAAGVDVGERAATKATVDTIGAARAAGDKWTEKQ